MKLKFAQCVKYDARLDEVEVAAVEQKLIKDTKISMLEKSLWGIPVTVRTGTVADDFVRDMKTKIASAMVCKVSRIIKRLKYKSLRYHNL